MNSPQPILRVALNGYGRVGRAVLRAWHEGATSGAAGLEIVAINEPAPLPDMAYLTRFDSVHGAFPGHVAHDAGRLVIDGRAIPVWHGSTLADSPWRGLDFDLLIECSGAYTTRARLQALLDAGCPRVLLSNPAKRADAVDDTIVLGVNDERLDGGQRLVSAASCTTTASVPVLQLLDRHWGVDSAFLTTLHAAMNDQSLIDGYSARTPLHGRSALTSMVPVPTGLAAGVERLLPGLRGRVGARHLRMPLANVSAIDMTVALARPVTEAALRAVLARGAAASNGHLACTDEPHASVDFNHDAHSATIDLQQCQVIDAHHVNLLLWFDNEWAFACRLLDLAICWAERWHSPAPAAVSHSLSQFPGVPNHG